MTNEEIKIHIQKLSEGMEQVEKIFNIVVDDLKRAGTQEVSILTYNTQINFVKDSEKLSAKFSLREDEYEMICPLVNLESTGYNSLKSMIQSILERIRPTIFIY